MRERIGIIGFGAMGAALFAGMARQWPEADRAVLEPDRQRRRVAQEMGASLAADLSQMDAFMAATGVVVLAVKPQILQELAKRFAPYPGRRLISIMAGISLTTLTEAFSTERVVRCMPNLAARHGMAATAICCGVGADDALRDLARQIMQAIGTVYEMPERLLAAHTGLSGSGIAYILQLAHAMALGGVKCGIDYRQAVKIATQTLAGAGALLKESDGNPIDLLTQICSPAGTTIEGVTVLTEGGFDGMVIAAVERAAERAGEIERSCTV